MCSQRRALSHTNRRNEITYRLKPRDFTSLGPEQPRGCKTSAAERMAPGTAVPGLYVGNFSDVVSRRRDYRTSKLLCELLRRPIRRLQLVIGLQLSRRRQTFSEVCPTAGAFLPITFCTSQVARKFRVRNLRRNDTVGTVIANTDCDNRTLNTSLSSRKDSVGGANTIA